MQEAEMEGMKLEVGWVWVCINKLMEVWLEQSKRKVLHTSGDEGDGEGVIVMGFDSDWRQLVFMLLVKTEN